MDCLSPFLIFIFLMLYSITGSAQQLSGKVVSKKREPLEFVNVTLIKNDTIKVTEVLSDRFGLFVFNVEKGKYTISFQQFGKELLKQELELYQNTDLGEIVIEQPIMLGGLEIHTRKKLIERKVDRLVFNVENSISATGGDALDALKVTPGIRIQNDQISMIGKSGMALMVDDRVIPLSGDDLTSYLKSITSDNIKSIEVITNPPAKYDAEGNSGIVNIKLKKTKSDSISSNVKSSYTQAKYPLANFDGGITYQKNRLTVVSNVSYSNGSNAPYQEYTIHYPSYTWYEKNKKRSFQNNWSGGFSVDYKISPKTSIGIQYSGTQNNPLRKGEINTYVTNNATTTVDSILKTPSYLKIRKKTNAVNFHSITKLDTLGKQFTFDLDYFRFESNLDNNFSSTTFLSDDTPIADGSISANNLSKQDIDIYSAKTDFEFPLSWINLSLGAKVSFINNDSGASYFNTSDAAPVFDPTKRNIFNYKENTQALYFSASRPLSKKWSTKFGLRMENTQTEGFSETLNQTNTNDYLKVFPTFYLTYSPNDKNTLAFNYNKRINRPNYSQLNPFRFYTSAYNFGEGNPFLRPYFTDNIELSYIAGDNYLSLYSSFIKNGFDEVTFVNENNSIQEVTPLNFFKQTNIGILENYTFRKWSFWESNTMINIFYAKTYSDLENIQDLDKTTLAVNSSNSFMINKSSSIRAQLDFNYQSPSVANSYQLSSFYSFDLGVRFSFLQKKLQLGINAMDVLRTNKMTFYQTVNGISQKSYEYQDSQKIRFSLTWNFGKSLKTVNRKMSNDEERKRAK